MILHITDSENRARIRLSSIEDQPAKETTPRRLPDQMNDSQSGKTGSKEAAKHAPKLRSIPTPATQGVSSVAPLTGPGASTTDLFTLGTTVFGSETGSAINNLTGLMAMLKVDDCNGDKFTGVMNTMRTQLLKIKEAFASGPDDKLILDFFSIDQEFDLEDLTERGSLGNVKEQLGQVYNISYSSIKTLWLLRKGLILNEIKITYEDFYHIVDDAEFKFTRGRFLNFDISMGLSNAEQAILGDKTKRLAEQASRISKRGMTITRVPNTLTYPSFCLSGR